MYLSKGVSKFYELVVVGRVKSIMTRFNKSILYKNIVPKNVKRRKDRVKFSGEYLVNGI